MQTKEQITIDKKEYDLLIALADLFDDQNSLIELGSNLCEVLFEHMDTLPPDVKDALDKMVAQAKECLTTQHKIISESCLRVTNLSEFPKYECPYCMQDIYLQPTEDEKVFEIAYHAPAPLLKSICKGPMIKVFCDSQLK